jgi:hypothetical protein
MWNFSRFGNRIAVITDNGSKYTYACLDHA